MKTNTAAVSSLALSIAIKNQPLSNSLNPAKDLRTAISSEGPKPLPLDRVLREILTNHIYLVNVISSNQTDKAHNTVYFSFSEDTVVFDSNEQSISKVSYNKESADIFGKVLVHEIEEIIIDGEVMGFASKPFEHNDQLVMIII